MAKVSKRRTPRTAMPRGSSPTPTRASGAVLKIASPSRPTTPANSYTSKAVPVEFAGPVHRYESADLEILGIDHSGASYEGRIFFNNPKANAATPQTLDQGYAGSFHIFGHGGCFGDEGHCDIPSLRDTYDYRDASPLVPMKARVPVTAALKHYAKTNSEITVTVVPVVTAANDLCDIKNVFRFERMRFLTYNS